MRKYLDDETEELLRVGSKRGGDFFQGHSQLPCCSSSAII